MEAVKQAKFIDGTFKGFSLDPEFNPRWKPMGLSISGPHRDIRRRRLRKSIHFPLFFSIRPKEFSIYMDAVCNKSRLG